MMNDEANLSKEELIQKIRGLQNLLDAMKAEKDNEELLDFPWIGNLGNWYWSVIDNTVICNDQKVLALGYSKEEIPEHIGFDYFTEKLHPDDYAPVMENMRSHLYGKTPVYEVTYRIRTRDGVWKWFYDRGMVTKRTASGSPELVVGIVFDVTEQKRMEEQLAEQNRKLLELSRVDYLTGIYNRRTLFEELEYEMNWSDRYADPFCILMFDIDHFKEVNDTCGHMTGDRILAQIAETTRNNIRKTDIFGRYGGEEFIVIIPRADRQSGVIVAEKIRKKIQETTFAENLNITISVGVVEYRHGVSIDELINDADTLLYAAKNKGRNRVVSSLE